MASVKSTSKPVSRVCSVCSNEKACIAVDDKDFLTSYYCLLHFSICDRKLSVPAKNINPMERVINQEEYSRQEIAVKEMWKEATAELVLTMFEYEKEEQKAARLSQAPIIIPRTVNASLKKAMTASAQSSKKISTVSDRPESELSGSTVPNAAYSWRRGVLADEEGAPLLLYFLYLT